MHIEPLVLMRKNAELNDEQEKEMFIICVRKGEKNHLSGSLFVIILQAS